VDFRDTPDEAAFRAELRTWLRDNLPADWADKPPHVGTYDENFMREWSQRLYDAGYVGLTWPEEFGGRGLGHTFQGIFLEESARAGAPPHIGGIGLGMAGPTIIAWGTHEQKARYLKPLLRGDEVWCQGFSEPTAGSDLASLRTRAVRDGDHYVVSGHKLWTSYATVADYCELLVRTDPDAPKHKGISWLVMPMDSPGIEIRPLKTVLGSSEFSEVYLDGVRIPVANRVGEENDGWRVTMVTLSFERGTAWVDQIVDSSRLVGDLAAIAKKVTRRSATAWDDVGLRRDIAHLAAEFDALWALTKRGVSEASASPTGVPGVGASVLKLRYTEARQRLMDLAARVLDRASLARTDLGGVPGGEFIEERVNSLSYTIAAGTSQIQRNIVGERILGLPRH
jgi:alkylation response protein AidB-like acyl-CoA dehydrogenase